MTKKNPVDVAKAYFSAVNETRLDDLAAVFAQDARLTFPMQDPIVSREAIRAFYEGVLEFYPTRKDVVTRYFVSDSGDVAAEIHFEGTTATGRDVIFDAVDVFTIEGDQIKELNIHYDSAKVMEMIGELPST